MKPIRLSAHAQEQAQRRGATAEEIVLAIEESEWTAAEMERKQVEKVYYFGANWNGKLYQYKKVRPIFVEENHEIIVVTVYTYYFDGGEGE